uniref:DUF5984 family protein n=1 Tax=Acetatifactor sp. TaxID=1872090 RepID=UPI0040569C6B
MNSLKINFQLQELDKIVPWGQEPSLSLHWFGLTDGLLWIEVGEQTIYEYSEDAQNYFGNSIKYNDYQISRFLEDFSYTFRYVGESIPEKLYNSLDEFESKTEKWKECHIDEEDEVFDQFYFNEYYELCAWRANRLFDSGHLVGGPLIGCFRCGDKIKILWESTYKLDNGNSIWTAPKGYFEMSYEEFVLSVTEFLESFFIAMDKQVKRAVVKEWGSVVLDKKRLVKENEERKMGLLQNLSFLREPCEHTDWDKVMMLYSKMEDDIAEYFNEFA